MDTYEKLVKFGQSEFDLRIHFKNTSKLMKFLSFLLFFNKKFMTSYSTTLGNNVYFPSENWVNSDRDRAARILAHELVHIYDAKDFGEIQFSYCYIFPQVLSTIAICATVGSVYWLLFLLFLLPVPAPLRTYLELRGYAITDMVVFEQKGEFSPIDSVVNQFATSSYYFMWPFKNHIRKLIESNRRLIVENKLAQKIDIADQLKSFF